MAGITAYYNQIPRIREVVTNQIIEPVSGSNPADLGFVNLRNVRGQVSFTIISGDNLFTSSFQITGGFGDFPDQWHQNWYPNQGTELNCTVTVPVQNRIQVTTPASDAGGRVYVIEFQPVQSIGPSIRQTSPNVLGNNNLTVRMSKQNILQGF